MQKIIGVMGPGDNATELDKKVAFELGVAIAEAGYTVLSGGRNVGVMDAVSRGASSKNGVVIGIIPSDDRSIISEGVTIPIMTNMSDARNNINALTADVVIICGMNPGTASEVGLAMKWEKPIILMNQSEEAIQFFTQLGDNKKLHIAHSVEQCTDYIESVIKDIQ